MSSPFRERQRLARRARHWIAARWGISTALAALASAHCTFPDYHTLPNVTGGSAGQGGSVGGTGAAGNPSAAAGGVAGAPDSETAGAAGAGAGAGMGGEAGCPGEQWPLSLCEGGCLTRYPDHCYDGEPGGDERDADCGGSCQPCTASSCSVDADCLSGACLAEVDGMACKTPLVLTTTAHELNPAVSRLAWSMSLANAEPVGGAVFNFRDLELRYYFARGGVVEPITIQATQANLRLESGDERALSSTSWSVNRVEVVEDAAYDAYVSVRFDESGQLFPGDSINLYQQMATGDTSNSSFDQRAHYSFNASNTQPWLGVTAYYKGQLMWGLEPRPVNPRACFARAVNFNGTSVNVGTQVWEGGTAAGVTSTNGSGVSQGTSSYQPKASAQLVKVLSSAIRLESGESLQVPAAPGTYLAYFYAVSPGTDSMAATLSVRGGISEYTSSFRAQDVESAFAWARLGPYRVEVPDGGAVTVQVESGNINFAGLELWYPE